MNINDLPEDILRHLLSWLNLSDLSNISQTSKPSNNIAFYSKNDVKKYIDKIEQKRKNIINIFSSNKVKELKISSETLWLEIDPHINYINLMKNYISKKWKNDNNKIIETFYKFYFEYYLRDKKVFINMELNHSFIMSVVMSLYH